jgi:putative transposase
MLKALKIRLYPTWKQTQMLNQHFGSCRFVYNKALDFKKTQWETSKIKHSKFDMIKWVTDFRKNPDFPWLQEVKCEVIQNQIDGLDNAFKGFFRGGGYPRFKKKSNVQSFTSKQTFKILENVNKIVFFSQKIKFRTSLEYVKLLRTSKIKRITYSKDAAGAFYVSVLIDAPILNEDRSQITNEIGIDLGLKEFLVTSDGERIGNPRFFRKSKTKLAKLQKRHSRKMKGSKAREKSKLKVAKCHKKIVNQRSHFFHQLTNKLIDENQDISLETLRVKNMIKNHSLAMSIQDASWSTFVSMLEYKAGWRGAEIRRIGSFLPSSKTCSSCGNVKELALADRTYECLHCGLVIDRDENAAINILEFSKNEHNLKQNRDQLARINATGRKHTSARLNVEEAV